MSMFEKRSFLSIVAVAALASTAMGEMVAPTYEQNLTVTTAEDEIDGCDYGTGCSLREALSEITENGLITFDAALSGYNLKLNSSSGKFVIDKNVTISGPAFEMHFEDSAGGQISDTILQVTAGKYVAINDLNLSGMTNANSWGFDLDGNGSHALYNEGIVSLTNCEVSGNQQSSIGYGTGIMNYGTLTIDSCLFEDNGWSLPGSGGYAKYDGKRLFLFLRKRGRALQHRNPDAGHGVVF